MCTFFLILETEIFHYIALRGDIPFLQKMFTNVTLVVWNVIVYSEIEFEEG